MASNREKIKLVSTGKIDGKPTGVFYTMDKNKRKPTEKAREKMRTKKYDKRLRQHVEFKEEKIK